MPKEIQYRTACEQDLPAIVSLLADDRLGAKRETPALPLDKSYRDAFDASEQDPNNQILLALGTEENGTESLLGCLQITYIPGLSRKGMLRGQIESVRVAAAQRGRGIGEALFRKAVEICRERGCGLVQLTSDKARSDALGFYAALGFKASHEGLKLNL